MSGSLARRLCLVLLVLAAGLGIGAWLLRSDEPVYQGKRLSAWIEALSKAQSEDESLAQVELRGEMLTNIVLALGAKAVPCALRWVRDTPRRSWYEPVQERIESTLDYRIRLPERKNRGWQGVYVFQILGPAARQAIPELAQMATNEHTCGEAFECLTAIGPASFPTISNALAVGSSNVCCGAIRALGELGPAARPSVPLLLEVSQASWPGASFALRALVGVTNAAPLVPLFQDRLNDPAAAPDAAYALARIGEPGLVPLLRGCTNSQLDVRAAAKAALDPRLHDYLSSKLPSAFDACSTRYNMALLLWRIMELGGPGFEPHSQRMQQAFQCYATNADPSVRSAALATMRHLETSRGQKH